MSDNDLQGESSGTTVKALAAAAATGAAAYAVQRALSSRNGHDRPDAEQEDDDSPESLRDEVEDEDDAEYEEPDDGGDDQPGSASSGRPSTRADRLRVVGSSALAGAAPVLVPLAGRAANSAGRYVAEHAPAVVKETIVPGFIEGFEKAS